MRLRSLGRTGIQVSELGFGGLFASRLGAGFDESRAAVQQAIELGINYIDTAPAYADSEEILGRILADLRVPLVLSTKLGGRPLPFDPRAKAALVAAAKESLRLLRRDVIDVLFIHEPDRPGQYDWWSDPAEVRGPVLDALEDLRRAGVIRYTGLGGTTTTEMSDLIRSDKFDVVLTAFNYSALLREATLELLPAARDQKMGVVLGSPLQQGALGRRYDDIVRAKPRWLSQARREQLLEFYKFLDELGMPIAEFCLRFAISRDAGDVVLIGPKTAAQVVASVRAVEQGPLSGDILARLDELARMLPYRPFEEPMIWPLNSPTSYHGPGPANVGAGAKVGSL